MNNKRQRIEYIDMLKGLAAILVVLGHIANGYLMSGMMNDRSQLFRDIYNGIYIFHMPLFIVISGFLYENSYFNGENTKKGFFGEVRFSRLLSHIATIIFLYFFFSIFHAILKINFSSSVTDNISLEDIWATPYKSIAPYWYLYILVIFYLVFLFLRKLDSYFMLFLLLFVNFLSNSIQNEYIPFEFNRICYYSFFFGFGIVMKRGKCGLFMNPTISKMLLCLGLFLSGLYWYDSDFVCEIPYINCIIAFSFIPFFWNAVSNISSEKCRKFFAFIGGYSLEIYVLHILCTSSIRMWLEKMSSNLVFLAIIINLVMSTGIPILIAIILKKLRLHSVIFKPFSFIGRGKDAKISGGRSFCLFVSSVVALLGCFLVFSILWAERHMAEYTYSDLILYKKLPMRELKEAYSGSVRNEVFLPVLGCACTVAFIFWLFRRKKSSIIISILVSMITVLVTVSFVINFWGRYDVSNYIEKSDYIKENYVNPYNVNFHMNEDNAIGVEKHNLIYIFTQIDDLDLSHVNEKPGFAGYKSCLLKNQFGVKSRWIDNTVFGVNLGLPIKIDMMQGAAETHHGFYEGCFSLGNSLQNCGYINKLLVCNDQMVEDYSFLYMAQGGYDIKKCDDYVNQLECLNDEGGSYHIQIIDSSMSGDEFEALIEAVSKKEYSKNTTFVITNTSSSQGVDSIIINPVRYDGEKEVIGTTVYDMFPTVFEAVGGYIDSDRVALGSSVLSDNYTSVFDSNTNVLSELEKKSCFTESMYDTGINLWAVDRVKGNFDAFFDVNESGEVIFGATLDFNIESFEEFSGFEVEYWSGNSKKICIKMDDYGRRTKQFRTKPEMIQIGNDKMNVEYYLVTDYGLRYKVLSLSDIDYRYYNRSLLGYIQKYDNSRYSIIVSAKDDTASRISESELLAMKFIGANTNLKESFRKSYIAVFDRGLRCYEKADDTALCYIGKIDDREIEVKSAGFECGNDSSILIDKKEYSFNGKGLNIVIYDNEKHKVISSSVYDTNDGETYEYRNYE